MARTAHRPLVLRVPLAAFPDPVTAPAYLFLVDETNGGLYYSDGTTWVSAVGDLTDIDGGTA